MPLSSATPFRGWAGGYVSQHVVRRPVGRYEQLEDFDRIASRIRESRKNGLSATEIAEQLNQEGFRSPAVRAQKFTKGIVNRIQNQLGIRKALLSRDQLPANEWWLSDLADELKINPRRLHHWVRKGYVRSRKESGAKYWILRADQVELERLRQLRDYLKTEHRVPYPEALTRPAGGSGSTSCGYSIEQGPKE
jgi:DNA-binding transcriptional MerR regulator